MAYKIANSVLSATTPQILNTIRANASPEYRALVPIVEQEADIPRVGQAIFGTPSLANEALSALMNRIALVNVKTATFYNDFKEFNKGYLEYGETVEEVFVELAKAREFSVEKAAAREFKRTPADVRSAFHLINWKVQYPLTVDYEEYKRAFLNAAAVLDFIAKLVDVLSRSANYDEYLLYKYLIIKAVAKGEIKLVTVGNTAIAAAKSFRATSNKFQFISTEYNSQKVHTACPRADQFIFMDADYNAENDVDVLASAFNMDKAEFFGKLKLVDSWTSFDNDRFAEIRANSDGLEEVTADELALMANVKAVLLDKEWFQMYDNLIEFTETRVTNGLYWNYNMHVWKTVSFSPFSNAAAFVSAQASAPASITGTIDSVVVNDDTKSLIINIVPTFSLGGSLADQRVKFVEAESNITDIVAVHPYGAYIVADYTKLTKAGSDTGITGVEITAEMAGETYTATLDVTKATTVDTTTTYSLEVAAGDTITLSKVV